MVCPHVFRPQLYLASALFSMLCALPALGQQPFYQEPVARNDTVLVASQPALTQAMADDYIDFIAWYFEMRFAEEQRATFTAYLVEDWKTSAEYRNNLVSMGKFMREIRAHPYADASAQRARMKANGASADAMRQMVDANSRPGELHNLIKYNARQGNAESVWLAAAIELALRPLVQTKDPAAKPFTRAHVDALVDLLVFRANAVAGRRSVAATEQLRDSVQAFLIDYWNSNPARHAELYLWLFASQVSWSMIQHNGHAYPVQPLTPYQLKAEISAWGQQVAAWFPELKPHAERRAREYQAYVQQMSAPEMMMELNRMHQRIAVDEQSVVSLRNQITKAHAVNMNAIEALGGGRKWEYKAVAPGQ